MDKQHNFIRPIARIIIKNKNKVLFVKRSKTDTSRPGQWELPGGGVDEGESFEQGAKREVLEETGLQIESLKFLKSTQYNAKESNRISVLFEAQVKDLDVVLSFEHSDFKWVDSSNYNNLSLEDYYQSFFDKYFKTDTRGSAIHDNDDKKTTKKSKVKHFIIQTDGGSRGNPGPSATGYVIMNKNRDILTEGGEYLGITTNNQAEYQAVKRALEVAIEMGGRVIDFYIDSMLIVKQMNGEYKIKNRDLWPIHENIKQMISTIDTVTFTHIRREYNKLADAKVNEVLDSHLG